MKINKKKVMVSALAVAMGAALVGSISGTIAWYQYSTRVTTAMVGTSAGVSRNLRIKLAGDEAKDYRSEVTTDQTSDFGTGKAGSDSTKLRPITYKESLAKTAALDTTKFAGNPRYQEADPAKWLGVEATDYVQYKFDVISYSNWDATNNKSTNSYVRDSQAVYLSDLTIQQKVGDAKKDISEAIRVHISATDGTTTKNYLISKSGTDLNTYGELDMNNDGKADEVYVNSSSEEVKYDFQADGETKTKTVMYGKTGETGTTQASYNTKASTDSNSILVAVDANGKVTADANKLIGTTPTGADSSLKITMTIWIEGWAELAEKQVLEDGTAKNAKLWSFADYVGTQFNVGATFVSDAVEMEEAA